MKLKNALVLLAFLSVVLVPASTKAYGTVSLSQTNINISVGQTVNVTYSVTDNQTANITYNTNTSAVSASIAGNNTVILSGLNNGSAEIRLCTNDYTCGTIFASVGNSGPVGGTVYVSQTNINLNVGQNLYVNVFGGSGPYYISSNSNPNAASASLNNNLMFLYGNNPGNTTISVCAAGYTCANAYINVAGRVLGSMYYLNSTLVNDNGTVYITYKNTKTGFSNMDAFKGLGYNTSNIISGSTVNLSNTNYVISSQFVAHPWGSWVKNGSSIYFVHENGLIPIPSYDIFINNGGRDAWVVYANSYDLGRAMLSNMVYNDSRLR